MIVQIVAQLLFALLQVHYHLQVVQLLGPPQVVHGIDERLLPHGDNLLADVLNDVVFELLLFILFLFLLWVLVAGGTLLLVFATIGKLPQQFLILQVHAVLLLLDGLDDLILRLRVVGPAIAVAGYLIRLVVPRPLDLRHVYPSLGLRLHFDGWPVCVHVCGATDILARGSGLNAIAEMVKSTDFRVLLGLRDDHDSALERKVHRRLNLNGFLLTIHEIQQEGSLVLLAHFGADLVNNLKHALLH